ncbi:unnamed protein product [Adineta ricciae]|uniref:SDE2-like domain-containing protein n=1 Tax=Adineta ricciae TaxID=249248 RepID=A0A814LD04_ADIRI|nr:unnamed protein product [Adineta ricciae]CAF1333604.1 unnamed protein product [Adineta ricciae]
MYIQIGHQDKLQLTSFTYLNELVEELNDLLGENAFLIEQNGKKIDLSSECQLIEDETYKIWPRILGGKGGFGSLLRSFGKQILISKNKEACRDLNGRRMRDVNNEKKLQEWMQKQLEKSSTDQKNKASASSNEEKSDYRNVPPPHKFSDAAYDEQKKQIANDMDEAVQVAVELIQAEKLKKKKKSTTAVSTLDDDDDDGDTDEVVSKKRRHSEDALEDGELKNKKTKKEKGASGAFFLGIDLGDVSSDDDDDDEEKIQKKKTKVAKKN